jgi:pimeloyl-ACP methyl ester carboxylesterase
MRFAVAGREAYAYTGARALDPARPTVLLVHGAGNDHSVWSLQSRYLAHHGHNVVAVDLPGHGRSPGPPLASVDDIAAWLAAALATLGIGRYAVVGHSLGALAALALAASHPAEVSALALLGPAVPMSVNDALLDAALHDVPAAAALITGWSHTAAHQLGGNPVPGLWMTGQARQLIERMPPGVLHVDLLACHRYADGVEAAARVRCPVLLVLGARDVMAPPRAAAPLQATLPAARTVQLPGAGHAMMAEAPDAVLDALRDLLR